MAPRAFTKPPIFEQTSRRELPLRIVFAILLLFGVGHGASWAQDTVEYDARRLTRLEVQMIQEGFIWAGTSGTLKDGIWGPKTIEAHYAWRQANKLRQSTTFNEAELILLLRQTRQAKVEVDWQVFVDLHTRISLGYPARFLSVGERVEPENGVYVTRFRSLNRRMSLSLMRMSLGLDHIRSIADRLAQEGNVTAVAYRLDREFRQVTSVDRDNGTTTYLRMDKYENEWRGFTFTIEQDKPDTSKLIVAISADFSPSERPAIDGTSDVDYPTLHRLLAAANRPPSMPRRQETGAMPPETLGNPLTQGVPLVRDGGILKVPVVINGVIHLQFILDSGASDVSIPADVVSTLLRTGTLKESDFLGTQTYVLADGSRVPSATFSIRSLRIGDRIVENVRGSVADVKGSLLLGQSFLGRFGSWSIDNRRQMLLLEGNEVADNKPAPVNAQIGQPVTAVPSFDTNGPSHPSATYWRHNGSVVYLETSGTKATIYYSDPREGMIRAGAKRGTLLFDGERTGNTYAGTAYIFAGRCGQFPYQVRGFAAADYRTIHMIGRAPRVEMGNCAITGHIDDDLLFTIEDSSRAQ